MQQIFYPIQLILFVLQLRNISLVFLLPCNSSWQTFRGFWPVAWNSSLINTEAAFFSWLKQLLNCQNSSTKEANHPENTERFCSVTSNHKCKMSWFPFGLCFYVCLASFGFCVMCAIMFFPGALTLPLKAAHLDFQLHTWSLFGNLPPSVVDHVLLTAL